MIDFMKKEKIHERAFRKHVKGGDSSFLLGETCEKLTQEQVNELQEMVDEARKKLESGDWQGDKK